MTKQVLSSFYDIVNENFGYLKENKQRTAITNAINYRCSQNKILFKTNQFIKNNPSVSTKDRLSRFSRNKLQKLVAMSNMPSTYQTVFNYHLEQNYLLDYMTVKVISENTGISRCSIYRAYKWMVNAKIMVIKSLGVGRLKCRQFNLDVTEWKLEAIRNKDFFNDTLRNAMSQFETLISIKNKNNTSIIKKENPRDEYKEDYSRNKTIFELDESARQQAKLMAPLEAQKRLNLEEMASTMMDSMISKEDAARIDFNGSHKIQFVKMVGSGKLHIDKLKEAIEIILKMANHPLGNKKIKNWMNLLFSSLRKKGNIVYDATYTWDKEIADRNNRIKEKEYFIKKQKEEQDLLRIKKDKDDQLRGDIVQDQGKYLREFLTKFQNEIPISEDDLRRRKKFEEMEARKKARLNPKD